MKTPQQIEREIARFCESDKLITEHLAMLKVGHDRGDEPERIMRMIIASALFRFHKIPVRTTYDN